jgi:hypothetical protein
MEVVGWQPTRALDDIIADVAGAQRAAAVL